MPNYKRAVDPPYSQIKSNSQTSNRYKTQVKSSEIVANWIMPCEGRISSPYGMRIHPITNEKKHHNGVDIAVPIGTPVKAIANGIVVKSGKATGYGNSVVLEHNINGKIYTSEYGHILYPKIKKGNIVKQGDVIAKSGNEGTSKGPHLHLTIRIGKYQGKAEDPAKFITDLRY